MKYKVVLHDEIDNVKEFLTDSVDASVSDFVKQARERAASLLPFDQYDEKFTHMVYWYEMQPDKYGCIEIRILMNPTLCDDKMFYDFVDYWKPTFVGAFHRR